MVDSNVDNKSAVAVLRSLLGLLPTAVLPYGPLRGVSQIAVVCGGCCPTGDGTPWEIMSTFNDGGRYPGAYEMI